MKKSLPMVAYKNSKLLKSTIVPLSLSDVQSTRELQAILESKGIHPIVDIWGYDVAHDWVWWEKQWTYFLQMTLGNP